MAYNLCPKMRRDFSKWILKAKKKGKNKSSQSGECKTEEWFRQANTCSLCRVEDGEAGERELGVPAESLQPCPWEIMN